MKYSIFLISLLSISTVLAQDSKFDELFKEATASGKFVDTQETIKTDLSKSALKDEQSKLKKLLSDQQNTYMSIYDRATKAERNKEMTHAQYQAILEEYSRVNIPLTIKVNEKINSYTYQLGEVVERPSPMIYADMLKNLDLPDSCKLGDIKVDEVNSIVSFTLSKEENSKLVSQKIDVKFRKSFGDNSSVSGIPTSHQGDDGMITTRYWFDEANEPLNTQVQFEKYPSGKVKEFSVIKRHFEDLKKPSLFSKAPPRTNIKIKCKEKIDNTATTGGVDSSSRHIMKSKIENNDDVNRLPASNTATK